MKRAILLLCTFLPSSLRLAIWRLMGFSVGRGCRVSPMSVVVADQMTLGPGAVIEPLTFIYRPRSFVMGERSRIASFVRIIGLGVVDVEPQAFIALGCLIDCTTEFHLGARSAIGPRGTYYTHGATGLIFNQRFPHRNGPIHIGRDCWLGMGCIVYPRITIGDRSLVLPGMVVSTDVAENQAILPPAEPYRVMPADIIRVMVTDKVRQAKMEEIFRECRHVSRRTTLDESRDDLWTMTLPGRGKILLLRNREARCPEDSPREATVAWQLFGEEDEPRVPTFQFDTLRIRGGWTPFAESIAAFLCESAGIHFVFDGRQDGKV